MSSNPTAPCPMQEPLLRFHQQRYQPWEHALILSQMQERGFAILSDVFEPGERRTLPDPGPGSDR